MSALPAKLKIPDRFVTALRVPGHPDVPLIANGTGLTTADGASDFPIIDGTPILINEKNSVFTIADFESGSVTTMDLRDPSARNSPPMKAFKNKLIELIPSKSRSVSDFGAGDAINAIHAETPDAAILLIGAGDALFDAGEDGNIVYTDVALGAHIHIVADGHDIPFADATFDAVIAVAVLEHVAEPSRVVAEIRRVLKPAGMVYSVTPFMQQVHMGAYDFSRFTALGHRRLFRWFDEIREGVSNGPGMVVSWSLEYMITTFSERKSTRFLLRAVSHFVIWPFMLFDRMLSRKAGVYDCASAYYFFGRLRETPIPDRTIIEQYKGLNN